jgi:hypothetical protein
LAREQETGTAEAIRDAAFQVKKEISASILGYSPHANSQSSQVIPAMKAKARAAQIAE